MVEVWFFYILAAIFFWGINSLVDKLMLGKHLSSVSYFFTQSVPKAVLLVGILIFVPIKINLFFFMFTAVAAVLAVISYYAYAFGLKKRNCRESTVCNLCILHSWQFSQPFFFLKYFSRGSILE